jgi:hypothetical protein
MVGVVIILFTATLVVSWLGIDDFLRRRSRRKLEEQISRLKGE